jgi:molecular chaperone HscB
VDIGADFFTLFQLAPQFRLDLEELDARYLELQGAAHPDRFAGAAAHERRLSMQWAARINEAYQTLQNPLERAQYLLVLAGYDARAKDNAGMDADFLGKQMEWREAVREARQGGNPHELERLRQRLALELQALHQTLVVLLDEQRDFAGAVEQVRQWMFLEKLRVELEDAQAFLEENPA